MKYSKLAYGPREIDVYLLDIPTEAELPQDIIALLSEDEQQRCSRYRHCADSKRFAYTRATLKTLLADRLGIEALDIRLSETRFGKPILHPSHYSSALCDDFDFNVSHSGEYALLALSRHYCIGVDIEKCDATLGVEDLVDIVLTPAEKLALDKRPNIDFYSYWTAKEATLKSIGLGLNQSLQTISIKPDYFDGVDPQDQSDISLSSGFSEVSSQAEQLPKINLCALNVDPRYRAALAWNTQTCSRTD